MTNSSPAAASGSSADGGKVYHLKLSTDATPNNTLNKTILATLKDDVAKATNGQLQITTYDSSTLYTTQALALAAAERGQVDMVFTTIGQALSVFPAFDGPNLAFLAPTFAQYFKLIGPGQPYFEETAKEVAAKGLTLLPIVGVAPGQGGLASTSKTPITSLTGLSGLKVRVPGAGLLGDELKALGADPVALSPTATPPALSSGAINAAFGSATFADTSLKGLTHGFYDTGTFQLGPNYWFINTKVWAGIPANIQQQFITTINTPLQAYLNAWDATQNTAFNQLQTDGNWVSHISPADVTKYQQQFAATVWPKFESEDKPAYDALLAGRKALGLS